MKTRILLAAIAMLCMVSANAQDGNNGRRQRMNRAEMIQRQSERLVKTLSLEGDKAEAFKVLYLDYQTARQNAANPKGENDQDAQVDMKNLTDAQATDLIQKHFDAQAAQLKVDKEYYGKFLGILTPAQAVRVFLPQRGGFAQGQRGQGRQRGNGGFGGGRQGGNGEFGGDF